MFNHLSYPDGLGVIVQDDGVAVWRGDGYVFIRREVWDDLVLIVAQSDEAMAPPIPTTSHSSIYNVSFRLAGVESYLVAATDEDDAFGRAAQARVNGRTPDDATVWIEGTDIQEQYTTDDEETIIDEC